MRFDVGTLHGAERRLRRWAPAPLVAGAAMLLLLSATALALRVPALSLRPARGRASRLDYSAGPVGGFAPLDPRFVASVLGDEPQPAPGPNAGFLGGFDADSRAVEVTHPLTNDDFADAYVVPSVPFTAHTNSAAATTESQEPKGCGPPVERGGTVWYRYTSTRRQALIANTYGTSYQTWVAVYSGAWPHLDQASCRYSPTGGTQVTFPSAAGETYYFQIGASLRGGQLEFRLFPFGKTTLASRSPSGFSADGYTTHPFVNGDGSLVAFASTATDLVSGYQSRVCPSSFQVGEGQCLQVYVFDRTHQRVRMVSQSSEGDQGNNASAFPYVADEGRFVSFTSDASNLVERDLDGAPDVFVRDLTTGRTERVSISSSGKEPVFPPDDEVIGALMLGVPVSAISADGRFVAFDSPAPNIVPGDTNGAWDVFIRDRLRGVTERVSLAASGTQASGLDSFGVSMSQDGRFVVFNSDAPLVPDDTNSALDVYIRDRLIGRTERVSVSSTDSQGNATSIVYQPHQAVSSDGRYVAFASDATNLVGEDTNGLEDVFVRDRATGITERVTLNSAGEQQIAGRNAGGNGDAGAGPAIFAMSRDGRFVAFQSTAANLDGAGPPGTGNVYLRDRLHATTTRISIAANGVATKASSAQPSISADGRHVAFQSGASNLTSGDNNRAADCFVYDLPPGMTS